MHIYKKAKKRKSKKHCSLCKKHQDIHTMHNNNECRHFDKDGMHKTKGRMPKPNKSTSGKDGLNFDKNIHIECRKEEFTALRNTTLV